MFPFESKVEDVRKVYDDAGFPVCFNGENVV